MRQRLPRNSTYRSHLPDAREAGDRQLRMGGRMHLPGTVYLAIAVLCCVELLEVVHRLGIVVGVVLTAAVVGWVLLSDRRRRGPGR